MNAVLRETLELARVVDRVITFSENHSPTLPVQRAAELIREGVIDVLRKTIHDLKDTWPNSDPKEIERFTKSLDAGAIPTPDALGGFLPKILDQELTDLENKIREVRAGRANKGGKLRATAA